MIWLEDFDLHFTAASHRQWAKRLTDIRGKRFDATYSALKGCYWARCPSNTYRQNSLKTSSNGLIGHGVRRLGLGRAYLTRHRDAIRQPL
jgi:hypothetical protein